MAANHIMIRNQHMWGDEDDPHTPEPPPAPKAKKIVPNADAEFVPSGDPEAERIAEEKAEMKQEGPKKHTASRRGKFTHNDRSGQKRQKIN
jgi:hypothetical protein